MANETKQPMLSQEAADLINRFGELPRSQAVKALQFLCTQYGAHMAWNTQVNQAPSASPSTGAGNKSFGKKGRNAPPQKKNDPELRVWRSAEKAFKVEQREAAKAGRAIHPATLNAYKLAHERWFRPKAEKAGNEYVPPSFKPKKEKQEAGEAQSQAAAEE